MAIQKGFSTRTQWLKLQRNQNLSVRHRTVKKCHRGKSISIWNGLTGGRILTYQVICSNVVDVTRHYIGELDLETLRTTSDF